VGEWIGSGSGVGWTEVGASGQRGGWHERVLAPDPGCREWRAEARDTCTYSVCIKRDTEYSKYLFSF
jgi:hypothetical protein